MSIGASTCSSIPGLYGVAALLIVATVECKAQEAPANAFELPDTRLYLAVVLNGRSIGEVVPVDYRAGHYFLAQTDLRRFGLRMPEQHVPMIDINQLPGVSAVHDNATQRLLITVPPDWLPSQQLADRTGHSEPATPVSSLGLLLNYDLYATNSGGRYPARSLSGWTEQRLFGAFGTLSNRGVVQTGSAAANAYRKSHGYTRYDTQWRYSDPDTLQNIVVGDLISDSLSASSSVRVAGIQVARNFSLRPDLITYPVPEFFGQAAVPSTVDLFINSNRMASHRVNPGPFSLQTMPYINGAGTATIVTRDVLGREVSEDVAFYISNELLKPGLLDYSFSTGALRREYGLSSFSYGELVASGITRYGVSDGWTATGWAEAAEGLAGAGLGSNVQLGGMGVLSASWGASDARQQSRADDAWGRRAEYVWQPASDVAVQGSGTQRALGYSYNNQKIGMSVQRTERTEGYVNLAGYENRGRLSRREDQAIVSVSLDRYGTLGVGWFDVSYEAQRRTRLLNLSHNVSLGRGVYLYSGVNKEMGADGFGAQLSLSIALGGASTASTRFTRDREGRGATQANYSRSVPFSGGVGWNLGLSDAQGAAQYRQADVTWRTPWTEARGGLYGTRDEPVQWGQLRGSVVSMDGQAHWTNTISDAFALVFANGYPDVPVYYENQLSGKTDRNGYFLIPAVTAWYPASIEIDPTQLPVDVNTSQPRRTVAVRQGSGYLVEFPIEKLRAVSLTLLDAQRLPIPPGSKVTIAGSERSAWVGWEGEVYLENTKKHLHLSVTPLGRSKPCEVFTTLPDQAGVIRLAPLLCE